MIGSCSWRAVAALVFVASLTCVAASANYPIFSQRFTADPSPLVHQGRVYVFASHDLDTQTWWDMHDFTCMSSDDLVNWTDHGEVFDAPTETTWATYAWAPVVVERNGSFFLYYTNARNGTGVAVASDILGPYVDPLGAPLVITGDYSDPAVLIDGDGTVYLHVKNAAWLTLMPDMIGLQTPLQGLANSFLPDYKEGGIIHEVDGVYNLSYVTNPLPGYGWSYAQAISSAPNEGFQFQNLWFWLSSDNQPNTHGDFFMFAGRTYMVYHNAAVALERGVPFGFQRSTGIDRLYFAGDGTIRYFTSTRDLMAQVRYVDPYVRNEGETMASELGIETSPSTAGGRCLTALDDGDWVRVQGVDLGSGADGFVAGVASVTGGATIEVRLDEPDGRVVASCAVAPTGGPQSWTTVTCPVTNAGGIRDVYLRFTGAGSDLMNLDWWRFEGGVASGRTPPPTVESIVCMRSVGDPTIAVQTYLLLDNQDGTWSFRHLPSRDYLSIVDAGTGRLGLVAGAGPDARFVLVSNPDRSWCLRGANGRFVVAQGGQLQASFDEATGGAPRLIPGRLAEVILDPCVSGTSSDCDLLAVDAVVAPRSPPADIMFGNRCERVDATLPSGRVVVARPDAVAGAAFDSAAPGMAGTLTYYQRDCACTNVVLLRKDRVANTIVLE